MNRWYFWVLAPATLATAIGLPFWTDPPTLGGRVLMWAISGALFCATVGLANPRRFSRALKPVAAVILLGYCSYAVAEFSGWRNGKPFGIGGSRSDTSLYNALCGLIVYGVPSILFLLSGRSGSSAVDALLDLPDRIEPSHDTDA